MNKKNKNVLAIVGVLAGLLAIIYFTGSLSENEIGGIESQTISNSKNKWCAPRDVDTMSNLLYNINFMTSGSQIYYAKYDYYKERYIIDKSFDNDITENAKGVAYVYKNEVGYKVGNAIVLYPNEDVLNFIRQKTNINSCKHILDKVLSNKKKVRITDYVPVIYESGNEYFTCGHYNNYVVYASNYVALKIYVDYMKNAKAC